MQTHGNDHWHSHDYIGEKIIHVDTECHTRLTLYTYVIIIIDHSCIVYTVIFSSTPTCILHKNQTCVQSSQEQ